jgi:hypothetical protein
MKQAEDQVTAIPDVQDKVSTTNKLSSLGDRLAVLAIGQAHTSLKNLTQRRKSWDND